MENIDKGDMMKRLFAAFLIFTVCLSTLGLADYNCTAANISSFSTVIPVNGANISIGPILDPCPFGCRNETGKCMPSPYDISIMDVGLLFGLIIFALIFFYLSFKFGGKEG